MAEEEEEEGREEEEKEVVVKERRAGEEGCGGECKNLGRRKEVFGFGMAGGKVFVVRKTA